MFSCRLLRRLLAGSHLLRPVSWRPLAGRGADGTGRRSGSSRPLPEGPGLEHFLANPGHTAAVQPAGTVSPSDPARLGEAGDDGVSYLGAPPVWSGGRVHIEVHGCQMNVSDTEVVWSILTSAGYTRAESAGDADVLLLMTCSIREGAEQKIWNKLDNFRHMKNRRQHLKIGVLGCMAERLKRRLVERAGSVDLVAGPDSYRHLPTLLAQPTEHGAAVNVLLSLDETYADVNPVRLDPTSVTAYVTIMRGCDNMCAYCIVPFTRGRERSRPLDSVVDEVRRLSDLGVREVTLLGQNVNSYRDLSAGGGAASSEEGQVMSRGFSTVYRARRGGRRFADLLAAVSEVDPEMRIRFTSPHPKDFPDAVLQLIGERPNICSCLHLPAQSGSSRVLEAMRRGYTREAYLSLVEHIRTTLPDVALTSDFIAGFCGETEAEFEETLSLMEAVRYQYCFLFAYSLREKTRAFHRLQDDVPPAVKQQRVQRMTRLYRRLVLQLNESQLGQTQLVLLEKTSRRSADHLLGRNDANVKVIVPRGSGGLGLKPGDYVAVRVVGCSSEVLHGQPLALTSLQDFYRNRQQCSQARSNS